MIIQRDKFFNDAPLHIIMIIIMKVLIIDNNKYYIIHALLHYSTPLQSLKVKYKKSWPHYQYIVIDKRDLAVYGYDNKLVAKWLNDLSKEAKKK